MDKKKLNEIRNDEQNIAEKDLQSLAATIDRNPEQITTQELRSFLEACERFTAQYPHAQENARRIAESAARLFAERVHPSGIIASFRRTVTNLFTSPTPTKEEGDAKLICKLHPHNPPDHTAPSWRDSTQVPRWASTQLLTLGTREQLLTLLQRRIAPIQAAEKLMEKPKQLSNRDLIEILSIRTRAQQAWNLLQQRECTTNELHSALCTVSLTKNTDDLNLQIATAFIQHDPDPTMLIPLLKFCPLITQTAIINYTIKKNPSTMFIAQMYRFCDASLKQMLEGEFMKHFSNNDLNSDAKVYLEERNSTFQGDINELVHPKWMACQLFERNQHPNLAPLLLEQSAKNDDDVLCYLCLGWPTNTQEIEGMPWQAVQKKFMHRYCKERIDAIACNKILASSNTCLLLLQRKIADQMLADPHTNNDSLILIRQLGNPWEEKAAKAIRSSAQEQNPFHGI